MLSEEARKSLDSLSESLGLSRSKIVEDAISMYEAEQNIEKTRANKKTTG